MEVSTQQETLSQACQWGALESEGNVTGGKKKNTHTHPQNMHLTTTTNGEAAQTLASASSEWRLGREAWAALSILRMRTGLECPEDNLRGPM